MTVYTPALGWRKRKIMNECPMGWPKAAQPAVSETHKQEPVGEVINERGDVDWISFVPSVGSNLYTTLPQPEQETVTLDVSGLTGPSLIPANWNPCAPNEYTTPPPVPEAHKRPSRSDITWVGLTDKERFELAVRTGAMTADWLPFMEAVEAKLKQKNGYAEEKNT